MARNELDPFPFKRHDKLDFFLKRHLDESVFNKIRMYEACIVVTEKKHKKAFHFVILTDECIYLTQNPPKSIHEAVHLGDVVAIELVNDYPEFLSGRDRESAQHIRISYVAQTAKEQQSTAVSSKYRPARISGRRKFGLEEVETNQEALSSPGKLNSKQIKPLRESSLSSEGINKLFNQLSSELLYGSSTSERTCSLLQELKATALRSFTIKKLFWKSNDLYPFLVEKLQQHLPSLQDSSRQQDQRKTKEDLQFCILIVETLGVMFRETETEPTRLELLNAERGLLVVNLLKILICGPQVSKACAAVGDGTPFGCVIAAAPQSEELQKLLLEYNDAVVSALYEIFLITHQGSWGSGSGNVMTVGWLMAALQRLPAMLLFIDHMMKRIIETVLSPLHLMSPSQALLLFQQLYILNTCLQYGSRLAEHIRSKYCEEFRYYIQKATVEAMLPVHYAVSQPAVRLLQQVLGCILQKPV
ncbi:uncharacterized protein C12orf56 homolog isoform X6 [Hypanus sabinus]|uniref:uncharacterized protein C12orf56 homolog isoform X6 n=1 Tax=Hypanus sabinus TaxID=79690 RepID=UPI0028C45C57|nr:uncharacterized protein C12orf56 homolog isoform X6 [Hypanus sabinus]